MSKFDKLFAKMGLGETQVETRIPREVNRGPSKAALRKARFHQEPVPAEEIDRSRLGSAVIRAGNRFGPAAASHYAAKRREGEAAAAAK